MLLTCRFVSFCSASCCLLLGGTPGCATQIPAHSCLLSFPFCQLSSAAVDFVCQQEICICGFVLRHCLNVLQC